MKRNKLLGVANWVVFFFALFCGGLSLYFGWLGYSEETKEEFYVNLSTSLGSITITVLVIDQLNRWRILSERKREIIEQMGSPVNDAALEAVRLAQKGGWLTDGSLKGAMLERANLQGADLRGANLQYANLGEANLQGAMLFVANLKGAMLFIANLQGADLREANLQGADLRGANFQYVLLGGAELKDANLRRANLQGAVLREANLQGANLMEARYNSKTIWPDGFDPEAVYARLVDAAPGQSEADSPA